MFGQPEKNSPFGYSVRFSITSAERYGERVIDILKSQDFNLYANRRNTVSVPKRLKEKKWENYGQKLIHVNGYSCKSSWHQQTLAPHINNGNGVPVFRNFISCPLVIDGRVFVFGISTDSGIRPAYQQSLVEYNKDKKPNDQIVLDTYQHLTHLDEKVLEIFNNIQFYGKVSQQYTDIIEPSVLEKPIACNVNHLTVSAKECLLRDNERIMFAKDETILVSEKPNRRTGTKQDLFTLTVPEATWFRHKISNTNPENGGIEMFGETMDAAASLSVKFIMYQPYGEAGKKQFSLLKEGGVNRYLNEPIEAGVVKGIVDSDGRHIGKGSVIFSDLQCKNIWYQLYEDPDYTNAPEAGVFNSRIVCPIIFNGKYYAFQVSIGAAIRSDFYKRKHSPIVLKDYLQGLANKVLSRFGKIQFHGNVSQDMKDVTPD